MESLAEILRLSDAHFDVSIILETWKFPPSLNCLERFERSAAVERLEQLERTDPHDERSEAVERLEPSNSVAVTGVLRVRRGR